MDEFTSIAIWVFATFLIVNSTIIWFANSNTFNGTAFDVPGLEANNLFGVNDVDNLEEQYYDQECSTVSPTDPQYASCVVNNLFDTFNAVASLPGKLIGALWKFLTAWYNLLQVIFTGVPAGDLFLGLLIPFFGIIQITSILVILMRVAGIIRGGS